MAVKCQSLKNPIIGEQCVFGDAKILLLLFFFHSILYFFDTFTKIHAFFMNIRY